MSLVLDADLLSSFARQHQFRLVVLFGSQARGRPHHRSDTDVAISVTESLPAADRWRVEGELGRSLGRSDLDVVWLDDASWLLTWEVSQGRMLFEDRPGTFDDFRSQAWLRYADSFLWQERDRRWFERFAQGDTTLNVALVRRKLNSMVQYLRDLESSLVGSPDEFMGSDRHYVAERLAQLLVDGAAAINTEVSQTVANIPPSDYYSSFFSMARTGWVDLSIASALAPVAKLRNRLVHAYEEVSLPDMFEALRASVPHWRAYLLAVSDHLEAWRPPNPQS